MTAWDDIVETETKRRELRRWFLWATALGCATIALTVLQWLDAHSREISPGKLLPAFALGAAIHITFASGLVKRMLQVVDPNQTYPQKSIETHLMLTRFLSAYGIPASLRWRLLPHILASLVAGIGLFAASPPSFLPPLLPFERIAFLALALVILHLCLTLLIFFAASPKIIAGLVAARLLPQIGKTDSLLRSHVAPLTTEQQNALELLALEATKELRATRDGGIARLLSRVVDPSSTPDQSATSRYLRAIHWLMRIPSALLFAAFRIVPTAVLVSAVLGLAHDYASLRMQAALTLLALLVLGIYEILAQIYTSRTPELYAEMRTAVLMRREPEAVIELCHALIEMLHALGLHTGRDLREIIQQVRLRELAEKADPLRWREKRGLVHA